MNKRYPFAVIREKLRSQQGNVLDFAIGKRRVGLPPEIRRWIRDNAGLAMKPAHHVGEFAEAAATLLRTQYAVDVHPTQILPTPGGRAAMSAIVACALEPGDGVLVTEPGYPAFARLAAHRHARVHSVSLDPDRAFAPDIGSISRSDAESMRVVALNYPNNPTGAVFSPELTSRIRNAAGRRTIFFNDATYGLLTMGSQPMSILSREATGRANAEAVELHSISKLFPLGPLAVSFLVGTKEVMCEISTYSEFAWSPLSSLQLEATTRCLLDLERLQEIRGFFAEQIQALRRTLVHVGFSPYPVSGGMYCLCSVPSQIGGKTIDGAGQAAEYLFDEFELAVVPWDNPPHHYLRFSALYRPEDLQQLADLRQRLRLTGPASQPGEAAQGELMKSRSTFGG